LNVEINERGKLTGGHSIADGNVNIVSRGMPNEQGIYSAKISVSDPKTLLKLLQKHQQCSLTVGVQIELR